MKKLFTLIVASAVILSLSACGKKEDNSGSPVVQQTTTTTAAATTQQQANDTTTAAQSADDGSGTIPGVLYQLNQKEDEEPVIRAVCLDGGSAGTYRSGEGDSVNGKEPSENDIRCIFELNEWISILPDTDKAEGLTAYIVEHQDDPQTYVESFFAGLSDDVPKVELVKPDDESGYGYWGELFVFNEEHQPGYYDLVFTEGYKPIAKITLKLYAMEELQGKTDKELNEIMETEAKPIGS